MMYAISDISNATSAGIGQTDPGLQLMNSIHSNLLVHLQVQKDSSMVQTLVLIHAAIPSDATYFVNYTNNPSCQDW